MKARNVFCKCKKGFQCTVRGLFYECRIIGLFVNELERIWKEAAMAWLMYFPGIYMEGLRKITKDSRCPDRGSIRTLPEYKSNALQL
jgi:hypothetical protein